MAVRDILYTLGRAREQYKCPEIVVRPMVDRRER